MTMNRGAIEQLRKAVGADHVVSDPHDLVIFERDASITGSLPDAIVFPFGAQEVSTVVKIARAHGLPVVPRGAGTGLSGGAVTIRGGIALSLARMHRILEIDPVSRTAMVEPGVVNADLSVEAARKGLFYAPDPSSQKACTIGGNAAENSGGPHCLYYGVTTNHIIGMEAVLADGSIRWVGGDDPDRPGLDLLGMLVGSEGTMCVITRIQVRLLPIPEAVRTLMAAFPTIETASHAVSSVIGHGIVPAALEMMDEVTVGAVEAHYHAGYPTDAGAVLLVEVDGLTESAEELMVEIRRILEANEAFACKLAADDAERQLLWAGRKGAIGALGRIKPNYYLHDGVVPRTRLPEVLHSVGEIGRHYRLPVANVFHAGDGNLHPNILFDLREPGVMDKVEKAGEEMLRACIDAGGTLSGEHGIGLEKNAFMPWIFTPDDLQQMHRVKDVVDPKGMFNPGKVFPDPTRRDARLVARSGVAAEANWW
ncbi:MAG TPA: FAD-linked oxidase C-terminal domain-containing protein [Candidatus Dormibacteraeota bacterium]|nr:FAD-linked oxidase C-terminal domain-containing protein [Candidatus Dormibacteraeota bacterium]